MSSFEFVLQANGKMPRLSLCHLAVTLIVIIKIATPSVILPHQAGASKIINRNPNPASNLDPGPVPNPRSAWYNPSGRTKLYSIDELEAMDAQVTSDISAADGDSSKVAKLQKLQYAINQAIDSLKAPNYGEADTKVAHETLRRLTKKL